MTTIGSTAYYNPTSYYGGHEKTDANVSDSYTMSKQQGAGSKSASGGLSTVTLEFQGKLTSFHLFDLPNARQMDISALPEDRYNEFMEGEQRRIEANMRYLENQYSTQEDPDLSRYAGLKPYADIVIGGTVVATVDNQGVVTSDDVLGKRLKELLSGLDGVSGPDFAQKIAEQIASLVGGRVRSADTALTQREFNSLPPIPVTKVTTDREGMKTDSLYAQIDGWKQNYKLYEKMRSEYLGNTLD